VGLPPLVFGARGVGVVDLVAGVAEQVAAGVAPFEGGEEEAEEGEACLQREAAGGGGGGVVVGACVGLVVLRLVDDGAGACAVGGQFV
jgi:hypothetical protein